MWSTYLKPWRSWLRAPHGVAIFWWGTPLSKSNQPGYVHPSALPSIWIGTVVGHGEVWQRTIPASPRCGVWTWVRRDVHNWRGSACFSPARKKLGVQVNLCWKPIDNKPHLLWRPTTISPPGDVLNILEPGQIGMVVTPLQSGVDSGKWNAPGSLGWFPASEPVSRFRARQRNSVGILAAVGQSYPLVNVHIAMERSTILNG